MSFPRRVAIGLLALLPVAPLAVLQACGGGQSTGTSTEDGGFGDGTTEGASGDGAGGADSGATDGRGPGDGTVGHDAGDGSIVGVDGGMCTPATGCPSGAACGHYVDPCSGKTFACGSPCPKGQVCSGPNGSTTCQPPSCAGKCGDIGVDSCGVPIVCPGCPTGQSCVNNACVPTVDAGPVADAGGCAALTCSPSPNVNLCGTVADGCGNTLKCACPMGQQCIGGVCQTTPLECDTDAGVHCGPTPNACGSGNVQCGTCMGTNTCTGGLCTPCTAPTCNGATCGTVSNGCGPAVQCGTCSGSDTCFDGGCCQALTCAQAEDAGLVSHCGNIDLGCGVKKNCAPCPGSDVCLADGGCCAPLSCAEAADAGMVHGCQPVDLGCGVKKDCSPCPGSDVCEADGGCTACVPKTCGDFGNQGCEHVAGCGVVLDCCAAGTVCAGSLCCQPGEVDYQGSCCRPACDSKLPPGPQVSCGVVLVCGQG